MKNWADGRGTRDERRGLDELKAEGKKLKAEIGNLKLEPSRWGKG
jgi:hypothetical protein